MTVRRRLPVLVGIDTSDPNKRTQGLWCVGRGKYVWSTAHVLEHEMGSGERTFKVQLNYLTTDLRPTAPLTKQETYLLWKHRLLGLR